MSVRRSASAAAGAIANLGELAKGDARALAGAGIPSEPVGGTPSLEWHALVAARQAMHG